VVMPETSRTHGPVMALFVPAKEAIESAQKTDREWLAAGRTRRATIGLGICGLMMLVPRKLMALAGSGRATG
jgi:hypothetical protein